MYQDIHGLFFRCIVCSPWATEKRYMWLTDHMFFHRSLITYAYSYKLYTQSSHLSTLSRFQVSFKAPNTREVHPPLYFSIGRAFNLMATKRTPLSPTFTNLPHRPNHPYFHTYIPSPTSHVMMFSAIHALVPFHSCLMSFYKFMFSSLYYLISFHLISSHLFIPFFFIPSRLVYLTSNPLSCLEGGEVRSLPVWVRREMVMRWESEWCCIPKSLAGMAYRRCFCAFKWKRESC